MNRSASATGDPSTLRERLVFLSDYTPPCNVRRKSSRTSASQSQSKLTVQDFVRMDPSYTTDIEHLVFPGKTPREQQQQQQQQRVASGKTRSRLAEMFALSRHLQQKSQDRESKMRSVNINRSVDSALDPTRKSTSSRPTSIISSGGGRMEHQRRWATPSEEPVRHQLQNATPNARTTSSCAATEATSSTSSSSNMSTARGPNVSILHLRSTSNPWDTSPTASAFTTTSNYRSGRNPMRPLTKHQSLVSSDAPKWPCASTTFHSGDEVNSADLFLGRRELSPVRWCDREVDGVYLGKSGWVQVQQRSLDESRSKYSGLQGSKRTGIKLANYHCVSEPGKCPDGYQKQQRPLYLTLREGSGRVTPSPSPPPSPPRSYSPPSLTPIISPPPAFQDKGRNLGKSRTFFGKTPFLPRSDAIVDSDVSPPVSPPKTLPQRTYKIPQTKSLEDTSNRRTQFVQRYGESSSSSSSSVGFRSLDSSRPVAMPRLSENTDSSLDIYEDADDEDNNSSSLATSVVSSVNMKVLADSLRSKEKLSPSNRNRNRQYTRKSPDGSGSRGVSSGKSKSNSPSSYSSSNSSTPEHLPSRRFQQTRVSDDGTQKVRRSRSLQLPERKPNTLLTRISPQPGDYNQRSKTRTKVLPLDEESVLREAEVVTEFLYGTRSRAAAQALLKHRYNNNGLLQDLKQQQKITVPTTSNGYNVFVVQNQSKPKSTPRGSISPAVDVGYSCCNVSTQMKVSQSYPTHQRSLDAPEKDGLLRKRSPVEQTAYHHHLLHPDRSNSSPSGGNPRRTSPSSATSSSSSDVWITATSDGASVGRRSPRAGGRTSTSTRGSTPLDGFARESVVTRPGSAPEKEGGRDGAVEAQQRSLSLPKSFLCGANTAVGARAASWDKGGSGSLRTSPNVTRKSELVPESSHTAPVTPSHEPQRRRSPLITRRTKAASTPQLIEAKSSTKVDEIGSCKDGEIEWVERSEVESIEAKDAVANVRSRNVNNAETVLQRFRKTFGLRFQRKGSKEGRTDSVDAAAAAIDATVEPSEEEDPPTSIQVPCVIEDPIEQKYRFGPLTWRSSKEKKKLNKAARSAKCNSGDSGIQIEMAVGSCGVGGDSSESHDTDDIPPDEPDTTPPTIRKRHNNKIRPHSDLLNQLLVDKLKPELKSRGQTSNQVRRTHSDLGGHRLLSYTTPYRRMMSSPAPLPRRNPPNIPQRNMLRRSLSQPLDMDKLLPKPTNFSEDDRVTSDELMVSDSESSSVASGTIRRKKSLELVSDEEVVILAEAVFDHVAIEAEELAFGAGDVVEVLETANRDWWWGSAGGRKGWFPAAFVRLRVSQEDTVEDCLAAMAGSNKGSVLRRRTSISLLSNDQVRTSVVRELVHTERDFVKVLTDVAEGYISECRKRKDMFSESQIQTIFINLEEILRFQLGFLKDLEGCIDWETPYKSCVGGCFLKHRDGFTMYSDYCNSHPVATATLQELYQYNSYGKFFEACRLMRGLIEIPLDGYLLTPVQRICKYPLQLAELLKYTKQDHEDYENIKEALKVMKDVAMFINERKRRMESLEKLAAWQMRVEGWEGEDLIETSSQLVHQGDVIRVKTGMWTNNITLFLFDHQAVYCKKDLLKKNAYVYKGRLSMDTTEVIDVPDGKDIHIGVTVRHAIKLYSCLRDKWLLFCCRNSSEKQRWLNAFAEERRLVSKDRTEGVEFPAAARQLARVAARCQRRRPPRKPRGMISASAAYMSSTLQLQQVSSNSLGRRMGGWFTFGGNKKARRRRNREDVS